jgi:hypothetical protein
MDRPSIVSDDDIVLVTPYLHARGDRIIQNFDSGCPGAINQVMNVFDFFFVV